MAKTHNLGFPRLGADRQLKFALERYFRGDSSATELLEEAAARRAENWRLQRSLDLVPVFDFSLYDHVLDASFLLGNVPERARRAASEPLDDYFRVARGRGARERPEEGVRAAEMTKWFDTNYHYLVPEFSKETSFSLDASRLVAEIAEARTLGHTPKPVLVGPLTYLRLGKARDGSAPLALLPGLLAVYRELLERLGALGVSWVQLDEPILGTDLPDEWREAFEATYAELAPAGPRVLLATYFGELRENLDLVARLPVAGVHLDATVAPQEVASVALRLSPESVLSVGIVSGRNVWRTDLDEALRFLAPLHEEYGDRLWLAPSCSLLHIPLDLEREEKMDPEVRSWLAFSVQKLAEIGLLARALNEGTASVEEELAVARVALASRRASPRVRNSTVRARVAALEPGAFRRASPYEVRAEKQKRDLALPPFPTTTIGSFPQTPYIRVVRSRYRAGEISEEVYGEAMRAEIARAVRHQEELGLDVFVHGEAERNDMVEYFGEQLEGYVSSEHGWVQSYGSRAVKPPLLFGDVWRPKAMTVEWIVYAQSLTDKPVKGMLTGPVTMLNWSFVRDDQPRSETCRQLALAIRDEVLDLERAGVGIVQIDEAALREGLPLRESQWGRYLAWAGESFRITAGGVRDETQIHTHMCYAEFHDILEAIAALDADVLTIETSRSNMELLDAFDAFAYPNEIGPGVYDIHSPNVPSTEEMVALLRKAAERIPKERLWVNPDCGLKTRGWTEVLPALRNMVEAAKILRASP